MRSWSRGRDGSLSAIAQLLKRSRGNSVKYLTAENILVLHALVIDETGGSHGIRDTGLLKSVAHKPRTRFEGRDLYPGVFTKTAVLLESIANYHVFLDGNKRTAYVAAARFLAINGYEVTATDKEVESVVLLVVRKEVKVKGLAAWLEEHSGKIA